MMICNVFSEIDCRSHMCSIPEDIQSVWNKWIKLEATWRLPVYFPASCHRWPWWGWTTPRTAQQLGYGAHPRAGSADCRRSQEIGARGLCASAVHLWRCGKRCPGGLGRCLVHVKGGQDGIWGLRRSVAIVWKMTIFFEGIDTKGVQLAPWTLEKKHLQRLQIAVAGFRASPRASQDRRCQLWRPEWICCVLPPGAFVILWLETRRRCSGTLKPWDPGTAMSVLQNLTGYSAAIAAIE